MQLDPHSESEIVEARKRSTADFLRQQQELRDRNFAAAHGIAVIRNAASLASSDELSKRLVSLDAEVSQFFLNLQTGMPLDHKLSKTAVTHREPVEGDVRLEKVAGLHKRRTLGAWLREKVALGDSVESLIAFARKASEETAELLQSVAVEEGLIAA
jgi:hypothetical protein